MWLKAWGWQVCMTCDISGSKALPSVTTTTFESSCQTGNSKHVKTWRVGIVAYAFHWLGKSISQFGAAWLELMESKAFMSTKSKISSFIYIYIYLYHYMLHIYMLGIWYRYLVCIIYIYIYHGVLQYVLYHLYVCHVIYLYIHIYSTYIKCWIISYKDNIIHWYTHVCTKDPAKNDQKVDWLNSAAVPLFFFLLNQEFTDSQQDQTPGLGQAYGRFEGTQG